MQEVGINWGCFSFFQIEAGNGFLQFVRCTFLNRCMKMNQKFIWLMNVKQELKYIKPAYYLGVASFRWGQI